VWLKTWATGSMDRREHSNLGKYIGVYVAFGVGSASLVMVQNITLWIFCAIEVHSFPI